MHCDIVLAVLWYSWQHNSGSGICIMVGLVMLREQGYYMRNASAGIVHAQIDSVTLLVAAKMSGAFNILA